MTWLTRLWCASWFGPHDLRPDATHPHLLPAACGFWGTGAAYWIVAMATAGLFALAVAVDLTVERAWDEVDGDVFGTLAIIGIVLSLAWSIGLGIIIAMLPALLIYWVHVHRKTVAAERASLERLKEEQLEKDVEFVKEVIKP